MQSNLRWVLLFSVVNISSGEAGLQLMRNSRYLRSVLEKQEFRLIPNSCYLAYALTMQPSYWRGEALSAALRQRRFTKPLLDSTMP